MVAARSLPAQVPVGTVAPSGPAAGYAASMDDDAAPERDWAAYYRHTIGREPRPLFARGMAAVDAAGAGPGHAVEIGFGDGTETLALLAAGWSVTAIDAAPAAADVLGPRVPADHAARLAVVIAPAGDAELPPFDLLYSGYVLSFLDPDAFARFWGRVRDRLRPGGFLVVNIFGDRDAWAGEPGSTFLARPQVDELFLGLDVLEVAEEDADGPAFSGPKHWHVFDVIARRPA